MMKNVTLRLPTELLRRLQHIAVDEGISLSAWLAKKLSEWTREKDDYVRAKKRALKVLEKSWHLGGGKFSRDELHER